MTEEFTVHIVDDALVEADGNLRHQVSGREVDEIAEAGPDRGAGDHVALPADRSKRRPRSNAGAT